ncbi:Nucleoporin nup120 [Ceratocystis platani]|uniref:Nucleoporin nup120 n=1 Tax=Ceratocystis fimbriata f. sp. platani TaxID=88771 RepID=A0A0F8CXU3_CERFI|nr:Nucleoporin nup120 [Ceratocystis platani]
MDAGDLQFAFVETRLNLEPSSLANVVNIRVASANQSNSIASAFSRRSDNRETEAETVFDHKNLAKAASIYHRKHHETPRGFLWRLLENNTILSIRAVDIAQSGGAADATLIINFIFNTPIAPNCVALADPEDLDALLVFVLDQANCLHTFSLRPDIFRRKSSLEPAIDDLCRSYTPSGLSGKLAHRLTAVNADQVLIALHDGGLLRLDRNRGHDHPYFTESMTNAQSWNYGVRSLFSRANTVKFGKWNLDYSTVIDAQTSNLDTEQDYLFTISLDHRMRVWDPKTGTIIQAVDMLNDESDAQEAKKWTLDPTHTNLVRVLNVGGGRGVVTVYSPKGMGQFNFWKVTALEDGSVVMKPFFTDFVFEAVSPSVSDSWTMADFAIGLQENDSFDIWVLWKNNTTYRVMHHSSQVAALSATWNNWELVRSYSLPTTATRSGPCDPADPTEGWLQLLMRPGRFTRATLETALAIYERSIGTGLVQQRSKNLAESICSVVSSTAALERNTSGGMDYEQFRTATDTHWKRFYRLVTELDKQRGDALSLVYDSRCDMPWIVCADYISAIRECNGFERLYWNGTNSSLTSDDAEAMNLLGTAMDFVGSFPENFLQTCNAVLRSELYEETTKSEMDRIQYFYEKAAFWRGIAEDDCALVVEKLGQNFTNVTNEVYNNIFAHILSSKASEAPARFPLTSIGRKLMVNIVQDNVDMFWIIFFTQLILLVHMEFEWEDEEDALHQRVTIGSVYSQTIDILRRLALLKWLTQTEMNVSVHGSSERVEDDSRKPGEEIHLATNLEAYLSKDLGVSTLNHEPMGLSLTEMAASLCAPDSTVTISVPLVQMHLIKDDRPDMALELASFSDQEPFSVYVLGRTHLALRDFTTAASLLRKAAVGMSSENAEIVHMNANLLADAEASLLGHGIAKYYNHLVTLFEKHKAYSYVLEFAQLAISMIFPTTADGAQIRSEMLSRQFNASLVLSRFDAAHSALLALREANPALQKACLARLVERMSETCHSSELVSLPFPGLTAAVDDVLSAKCRSTLDVVSGPAYHQVLYAWRIRHNDYRGAASVLLDRIHKLQRGGEGDRFLAEGVTDTPITRQYLLLINALSCVDRKQAWIFSEELPASLDGRTAVVVGEPKRKVVTLADVRKQYQLELDRIAAIQSNDFGFEEGDVMEP